MTKAQEGMVNALREIIADVEIGKVQAFAITCRDDYGDSQRNVAIGAWKGAPDVIGHIETLKLDIAQMLAKR